jgi:hypothetical protein
MNLLSKLYPRATEARLMKANSEALKFRNKFFKASGRNFLLLQLLFLSLFAWNMGSLYQLETHAHNINIAFADYDRGAIGQAVRGAYSRLQGRRFPSLVEQQTVDFRSSNDLREAVCRTQFWAALYVSEGASTRLHDSLTGASTSQYDPSNVLTYIWNEANYPTAMDSVIASSLQTLSSAARVAYTIVNGTGQLQDLNLTSTSFTVLANPWTLTSINIEPTTQGTRLIYNTVVIILIMIQDFFYLGTINGLYVAFKIYPRMHPLRIIVFRLVNSLLYTLVGSLCTAGMVWAFRSGWAVSGGQFGLTWLALWLFSHITFQALDVFTIWLPLPYVPMALISWVILNVTSILLPFQLSPGWYKVGYLFPAHAVYQTLTDIWSRGCNPRLDYALPVMFAWWIVTFAGAVVGVYKRCHYATLAVEAEAKALRERAEAALEFERAREREREGDGRIELGGEESRSQGGEGTSRPKTPAADASVTEKGDSQDNLEEQLEQVMNRTDAKIRKEQSRASGVKDCQPAFHLAFGGGGDSDE